MVAGCEAGNREKRRLVMLWTAPPPGT